MSDRNATPARPSRAPFERGDDRIRPLTRAVAVIVLPFLTAAVVLLYLFPGDTERLFAWTIQPPLTAMVLAAAYCGGIWFFIQVLRQQRWHCVRHGFPGALLFATLLAVATVLHWDRFHAGHISFITWATLYLVTPFLLLGALVVNWRADRGRPDAVDTTIPRLARVLLALFGAAALATGLVLFLAPTVAIGSWAWEVTPLTARVIGTVLTLPGTVHLWLLLDSRWSAFRCIFQAQLVSLVFFNLAVLLCRDQLIWTNPVTLPVVSVLALAIVAYAWLYLFCEGRARRSVATGSL